MASMKHIATPLFEHDCSKCRLLGNVFVPFYDYAPADMYKCGHHFILRFSNDDSDTREGTVDLLPIWFRTETEIERK